MNSLSPSACRMAMRSFRKQLLKASVAQSSALVSEKIMGLPYFLNSQHIAYYLSDENEVDLSQMASHALALKKSLYLPVVTAPHTLAFYRVDENTRYQKNKWGILEPLSTALISVDQLDLMLIPLVAFDANCHRMGRGLGCYDRYLQASHHCHLMGVAYEFQKVPNIAAKKWDVQMDCIVTERALYDKQCVR